MKKIILLLALISISCEKDREVTCWSCRWENTKPLEYRSTVTEICDKTEFEIREYERENTWIRGDEENEMICWELGDTPIPPDN